MSSFLATSFYQNFQMQQEKGKNGEVYVSSDLLQFGKFAQTTDHHPGW